MVQFSLPSIPPKPLFYSFPPPTHLYHSPSAAGAVAAVAGAFRHYEGHVSYSTEMPWNSVKQGRKFGFLGGEADVVEEMRR